SEPIGGARETRPTTTTGRKPGPLGIETIATRELLEVLLNEPSYYDSIESQFDPELLGDEQETTIARALMELVRTTPGFALAVFLGRFESVEVAQRVIELHSAGERRGNFAATIEGAV